MRSHLLRAAMLGLVCGLTSVTQAGNGLQWRLQASVPVMCAILSVETPADRPASLTIITTCNAQRYQLVLSGGIGQAEPRAAFSSAGPVQIDPNAVTITSTRPGHALTTIDLTAPVHPDHLTVTLQPI